MGDAPTHPWAKDTRRLVRFGEVGESDLEVELNGQPRSLFVEVKPLGWKPPAMPKFGAAVSTLKKYRHHLEQIAFQKRQRDRGHFAIFARSPYEVYVQLVALGFRGLPIPADCQRQDAPRSSKQATRVHRVTTQKTDTAERENGSQLGVRK
jgi:hypothetical protein